MSKVFVAFFKLLDSADLSYKKTGPIALRNGETILIPMLLKKRNKEFRSSPFYLVLFYE